MPDLLPLHLDLSSCPHCGVAKPNLSRGATPTVTYDHTKRIAYRWAVYVCSYCGLCVLGIAHAMVVGGVYRDDVAIVGLYPSPRSVSDDVPDRAKTYLSQAIASLNAPDGACMLAASAVDAMLKAKGFTEGSLYARINKAASDHLITDDMAKWAHEVRLDANEPRHADVAQPHHTFESAARAVDFASALADLLFVVPARVARGRRDAAEQVG